MKTESLDQCDCYLLQTKQHNCLEMLISIIILPDHVFCLKKRKNNFDPVLSSQMPLKRCVARAINKDSDNHVSLFIFKACAMIMG